MLCACQRDPFAAALVTASQIASATVDRPGRRQFIWEGYSAQEEKGRGELRATGVSVNKPITSRLPSCTSSEAADRPGTAEGCRTALATALFSTRPAPPGLPRAEICEPKIKLRI